MANFVSKILKKPKQASLNLTKQKTTQFVSSSRHLDKKRSMAALHKAAIEGNWDAAKKLHAAEKLLTGDIILFKTPITEGGEIALHIAAVEGNQDFVSKLLEIMEEDDVKILNAKGCTALCFAAAAGHTNIAQILVEKCPNLPTVKGEGAVSPLYMAALRGFGDLAEFLYRFSNFGSWTQKEKIELLTSAIESELYDLAIRIMREDSKLIVVEDVNGETPLQVLARKPLAYSCNTGQGFWVNIITRVLPCMKKSNTHDGMSARGSPYELLDCLWAAVESYEEDIEAARAVDSSQLFFLAAEAGNDDFLVELIRKDHNLLYKVNRSKHSIFHIAVLHRYVKVFNLMYEFGGTKDLMATYIDDEGNNILHLAGKLAPPNQLNSIPSAALQMQREVLWFKAVEKLVGPSYRSMKNSGGQTPHELFINEHRGLMKEGEKFMKQIAKSCMLVTMLIATVVYTTAFTVPGGYDSITGVPILEKKRMFNVFPVSVAVATLSSLSSMLMFLSILTSRYSDEDFLKTLPCWLVVGMAALFFSIVAMMVAFCTCLLFFEHGWVMVTLFLVFFASVPAVFVVLMYRLLMTVLRCTYGYERPYYVRPYNR